MILAWASYEGDGKFEMVLDGFNIIEPDRTPDAAQFPRSKINVHGNEVECSNVVDQKWVVVGWSGREWLVSAKLPPVPRIGTDNDITARKEHGELVSIKAYERYLEKLKKEFKDGGGIKAYIG